MFEAVNALDMQRHAFLNTCPRSMVRDLYACGELCARHLDPNATSRSWNTTDLAVRFLDGRCVLEAAERATSKQTYRAASDAKEILARRRLNATCDPKSKFGTGKRRREKWGADAQRSRSKGVNGATPSTLRSAKNLAALPNGDA
jgi:hypothetical protein